MLPSDSHYELLEVAPTASFEDIRRGNRRIRDVYGAESIAVSGLYNPASLEAVHRRLDLAYTTLMDAAKRKEYDLELFPDGVPMPIATPAVAATAEGAAPASNRPGGKADDPAVHAARPPMPELSERTEFSGPLLRQIREAVGVELREIAERSKIGMAYLQALEGEVFAKLPAPVYVRGFLAEYARALGLDAERVKARTSRGTAARGAASTRTTARTDSGSGSGSGSDSAPGSDSGSVSGSASDSRPPRVPRVVVDQPAEAVAHQRAGLGERLGCTVRLGVEEHRRTLQRRRALREVVAASDGDLRGDVPLPLAFHLREVLGP